MEGVGEITSAAVVILNWNGVSQLRQFLPSVVAHTPAWVDIIVADNGSTDESCDLVRGEFSPRVKLLEMDQNRGFAGGYNYALEGLDHQIFILLNSDVEVTPMWVEPLIESFAEGDDIAAVGSKLRSYRDRSMFEYAGASGGFIDYLGYPFCRGRILSVIEEDRGQYDDARDVFWVSGAAFACRADLFRQMGGFDADFFAHQEEIDLCWRFQLAGYRVRIEPRSVIYHVGGATLSVESPRKTMYNHRNNLAMLYKCAPTRQRIVVAVVRPFLDLLAALSYLVQGHWRSALSVGEAWCHFIGWHRSLSRKRREIRSQRKAESRHIFSRIIMLRLLTGTKHYQDL